MRKSSHTDVAVVGGGIIGLAIARELTLSGASVVVFDRSSTRGPEATDVAAGMLAPVGELEFGEDDLLPMNLASADLFPEIVASLAEATGLDPGYRRDGGIHVAPDRDEAAVIRRMLDLQISKGLDSEWLGPGAAREVEPGLSPSVHGAVFARGDGSIDPRAFTEALEAHAVDSGAEVARGVAVDGLVLEGDRAVGLRMADGREVGAATVVVACGAATGRLGWLGEVTELPVRPVKGQVLELGGGPEEPVLGRPVVSERVYIVPRPDGRVVVGATVEDRGWDLSVTAGGVHELLREAYRILPDVAELDFLRAAAGLRPGSPDNLPIVGRTGVEGLVVASGHYRNGVLLAPLTGRAVAGMISGDTDRAPGMEAADPLRFDPVGGRPVDRAGTGSA